ncbi:MAG: lysylphosphatidylglycerol synthase transmembrane domain-containing protein [Rhodothermales bacterium]
MSERARTWAVWIGSVLLGGLLLYLSLRQVDFAEVATAFRDADYRWLAPLAGIALLSHGLRAWRWRLFLDRLPLDRPQAQCATTLQAFYSVMIGYMVNYVAARLSEFVRVGNLAVQTRQSYSAVLGTVVLERLLDIVVLALGVALVFGVLISRGSDDLLGLFAERLETVSVGTLALAAVAGLVLLVLIGVFLWRWMQRGSALATRMQAMLVSFSDGLKTILRLEHPWRVVGATIGIWGCYVLLAYGMFFMFALEDAYPLTLIDGAVVLFIGSLSALVPTPGGAGASHFLTITLLTSLYGIDPALAASYAVFSHGGQWILYTVVGVLCMALQGRSAFRLPPRLDPSPNP